MKLVVIIPALNEEKTIASVIAGIPRVISGITGISVVVINDGSSDNTPGEAMKAGAEVVSHDSPQGLGSVFKRGVHEALLRGAGV
ncbi:MAG: glycosyltransferase, partial [Patescibacteria group bacterium]